MSSGVQTMTKWTIRSSLPCKHGTSFVHGLLHLTVFSSSIVKIKILAIFLSNIRKTLKKKKKEYMCPQPNQGRNLGEANQIIAPRPWLGEPDPASGWARGPLGTWHWDSHSIPFQGHKAWGSGTTQHMGSGSSRLSAMTQLVCFSPKKSAAWQPKRRINVSSFLAQLLW